jgi:hypothetical protein
MTRFLVALAALLGVACFPGQCFAQAQARFAFEGVANCHQPALANYPIRGEGTGRLTTDGRAELDVDSNIEGRQRYDTKLGRTIETPGGSATLRVASRRSLRVVRDYPNNILVIELRVVGKSCKIKVESRLKPGKRQYTFATQFGTAYCDRPVITKTMCEPF